MPMQSAAWNDEFINALVAAKRRLNGMLQRNVSTKTHGHHHFDAVDKTFGAGLVVTATPMGNDTLLEIAFDGVGIKKLMANFAKIQRE